MSNQDYISSITQDLQKSDNILKDKFGLNYNPFPKSGIAVIDEADEIVSKLSPINQDNSKTIVDYIRDALDRNSRPGDRSNLSLLIIGDYGTGKTQTLMFLKYVLRNIKMEGFRPYVVYIDNPGKKLSDIVGNIVSQVGVENFRRYLWEEFWTYLQKTDSDGVPYHCSLVKELRRAMKIPDVQHSLFKDDEIRLSSVNQGTKSYKYMYDSLVEGLQPTLQKQITNVFRKYMVNCFSSKYQVSAIAEYFYDIVSDSIGVNKSWDLIIRGEMGVVDKREVNILNAVVEIVKKNEDCTHFIMLIDEFEEVTVERVKAIDKDNYLRNLRTFIDKDKNWSCVFAMTGKAFELIESYSPPLATRIADRKILLGELNETSAKTIIGNYLSIGRGTDNNDITPFDNSALEALLNTKDPSLQGSPRFLLKSCYLLLQRLADSPDGANRIDASFVKKHLSDYIKK